MPAPAMHKSKPKCSKGTACGYSCINGKYTCSDKILKRDADALLAAVKRSASFTLAESAIAVDPAVLADARSLTEMGKGYEAIKAALGDDPQADEKAVALKSWLGNGYKKMSELNYKAEDELDPSSTAMKYKGLMALAVTALRQLPTVTAQDIANGNGSPSHKRPEPDALDKLNRWISVDSPERFVTGKYKVGETISEDGMFGTTHLPDLVDVAGVSSNVQYSVKAKASGGQGRAVDQYKNENYEGEILFPPGTKFKVAKVEGVDLKFDATNFDLSSDKDLATADAYWGNKQGDKKAIQVVSNGSYSGGYITAKEYAAVKGIIASSDSPSEAMAMIHMAGLPKTAMNLATAKPGEENAKFVSDNAADGTPIVVYLEEV